MGRSRKGPYLLERPEDSLLSSSGRSFPLPRPRCGPQQPPSLSLGCEGGKLPLYIQGAQRPPTPCPFSPPRLGHHDPSGSTRHECGLLRPHSSPLGGRRWNVPMLSLARRKDGIYPPASLQMTVNGRVGRRTVSRRNVTRVNHLCAAYRQLLAHD